VRPSGRHGIDHGATGLSAEVTRRIGPLALEVALEVAPGETVAVLGPNGAGKTTLFRCLAGLLTLDAGHVTLDGVLLDDPGTRRFVPPERRRIGVVFQDYLLFPHLSALENVAFGLRARGVHRRDARTRARAWLDRVGLADHARHRPRALSGGQAQRVALARALATEPHLLLLDEPLAALDAGTRGAVRRDLRRHLDGFAGVTVLVTHDPIDAYALADRVVVVEQGRVVQAGTLAEVTAHPRSRYVAELVGMYLLAGRSAGGTVTLDAGGQLTVTDDAPDGPVLVALRPSAIAVHRERPSGSPRNVWAVVVADVDRHADRVRLRLDGPVPVVAEITTAALAELGVQPGDPAWASVKATEPTVYAA
jgi:molybdate transport system ATP-binding protein